MIVVLLVVVVDGGKMVALASDLRQRHVEVDVVDSNVALERLLRVSDRRCLGDVAHHVHFESTQKRLI